MSYDANGARCIRVYYQDRDNMIREICKNGDGAWFDGYTFFPAAIKATSIACSHILGETCSYFLYYQRPDSTFVEYISQNTTQWRMGKLFILQRAATFAPLLNLPSRQRRLLFPAPV